MKSDAISWQIVSELSCTVGHPAGIGESLVGVGPSIPHVGIGYRFYLVMRSGIRVRILDVTAMIRDYLSAFLFSYSTKM